eukprot:GHVQ01005038.1.p1 GENE.GHVQ01005038.1~~GHVQ01005038.1.p1  ORF type:complete len:859 (-),score=114.24 GHVQ01005038.1:1882-4458(-)
MNVSGSHLSKEFFELVKSIGESRSKQEEDRIIVNEVAVLKLRLNEPNVTPRKMKEYLVRAVYVEMLGHDASFSYIHAVKLTHEKQLLCKRMGYLACNVFLHKDHELMLLLINTIQRDLSSVNHLEVSAALTCVCRLVNNEMHPAIFPLVKRLMSHSNEVVRKKACMALHRLHSIQPESVIESKDLIRRSLCDPDPAVMGSSLHVLHELAKEDPGSCKDLIPSLVSILKQICEHRLPGDYDYHRMPAPWLQVKLLSLLSTLGSADKRASEQMYETLHDVMRRADAGVNVGYAIIYECVKTITSIYPSHQLLELAASSISRFIGADNHNLKYVGVTGLGWIVQVNSLYASQHQLVVVDCLEDPDETLKRKTLDLLYQMTNPKNVTVVVDKLSFHLRTSVDQHLRRDLASKITHLAERYAPSNHWYLDAMITVFESAGTLVDTQTAYNLTQLIAEGPNGDEAQDDEFRAYAANKCVRLCDKVQTLPDILVQIVSWVLGEYGSLCSVEGYTNTDDIIDLLCDCIDRTYQDPSTRGWITSAIMKLCASSMGSMRGDVKCYKPVMTVIEKFRNSQYTTLQQKCYELQLLLKELTPEAIRYVLPYDASSEDLNVDTQLRFLDSYVRKALSDGARPYQPIRPPHPSRLVEGAVAAAPESAQQALNFTPYEAPSRGMPLAAMPSTFRRGSSGTYVGGEAEGSSRLSAGVAAGAGGSEISEKPCGFQVQGPRRWGPTGYVGSTTEAQAASRPPPPPPPIVYTMPSAPPTAAPSPPPPPPPPPRELTEREKTAAALFSGLGSGHGSTSGDEVSSSSSARSSLAGGGVACRLQEAPRHSAGAAASVCSAGGGKQEEKKTDSSEDVDLLDL